MLENRGFRFAPVSFPNEELGFPTSCPFLPSHGRCVTDVTTSACGHSVSRRPWAAPKMRGVSQCFPASFFLNSLEQHGFLGTQASSVQFCDVIRGLHVHAAPQVQPPSVTGYLTPLPSLPYPPPSRPVISVLLSVPMSLFRLSLLFLSCVSDIVWRFPFSV